MKKEKKLNDTTIKLMCRKSFKTCCIASIKKRRHNQKFCEMYGIPVPNEIYIPDEIKKDELLEFKIYCTNGYYWISSQEYDFNLNQNELDEYFENEINTSRILKLRKLEFINI